MPRGGCVACYMVLLQWHELVFTQCESTQCSACFSLPTALDSHFGTKKVKACAADVPNCGCLLDDS